MTATYLFRHLQERLPLILEESFRNLPFENGDLIPTDATLTPGITEVVATILKQVGDAAIIGDNFDIPLVEIGAGEDTYKVIMVASAMAFSFQGERASAYARSQSSIAYNVDPYDLKLATARRAIAEKMNKFAACGHPTIGAGFLNNPLVPQTNSSFDAWTATGQQLVEFFVELVKDAVIGTNTVEHPTEILIPTELDFRLIETTLAGTGLSAKETIINRLNTGKRDDEVKIRIVSTQENRSDYLEANGVHTTGTNRDRIVVYPMVKRCVNRIIENSIAELMPEEYHQVKDGKKIIPMFSCTTPTMINYPDAFQYVDITKESA